MVYTRTSNPEVKVRGGQAWVLLVLTWRPKTVSDEAGSSRDLSRNKALCPQLVSKSTRGKLLGLPELW